jgi:hypothetical protein
MGGDDATVNINLPTGDTMVPPRSATGHVPPLPTDPIQSLDCVQFRPLVRP